MTEHLELGVRTGLAFVFEGFGSMNVYVVCVCARACVRA